MAKKHFTRHAYPPTRRVTAASVSIGDFVKVGAIRGFALEATRTSDGDALDGVAPLAGTVLLGFGEVESAPIVSFATGGGVAEGEYLLWDAALLAGDGAFTDEGATQALHDAIAGAGVSIDDGETGSGQVLIPAPY